MLHDGGLYQPRQPVAIIPWHPLRWGFSSVPRCTAATRSATVDQTHRQIADSGAAGPRGGQLFNAKIPLPSLVMGPTRNRKLHMPRQGGFRQYRRDMKFPALAGLQI
jgi:hypothetical protein